MARLSPPRILAICDGPLAPARVCIDGIPHLPVFDLMAYPASPPIAAKDAESKVPSMPFCSATISIHAIAIMAIDGIIIFFISYDK